MEQFHPDYGKPMLISPQGEVKEFIPRHITHFEIEELVDAVGGKLEIINVPDSELLLIYNENSKELHLPPNQRATDMLRELTGNRYAFQGNLIITPNAYMGTYYLP